MNHPRKRQTPVGVDWPFVMACCERRGTPASRVDRHGNTHILRTLADLKKWDAA